MKKIAQGIVRFRKLILTVAFLLLIPTVLPNYRKSSTTLTK